MERDDAIRQLPETYQRVLALLDRGCSEDEIAVRLAIDARAAAPLIELARAKLARLGEEEPA